MTVIELDPYGLDSHIFWKLKFYSIMRNYEMYIEIFISEIR